MKSLNQELVNKIISVLKGAKLKKFKGSVDVLNESLEQGSWIKRGSVKAQSGFYQGILKIPHRIEYKGYQIGTDLWKEMNIFFRCLNYGLLNHEIDVDHCFEIFKTVEYDGKPLKVKYPEEVLRAWVSLCIEKEKAFEFLNTARPKPILSEIKLSKRVTTTLKEMNLDIELSSLRYPDLKRHERFVEDEKGKKKKEVWYEIIWPEGIKHNKSRFSGGSCNCQACGKYIPSGLFVPLYARDNKSGDLVSFLLGRDCASNIFSVKDVGINLKKDDK
jgi:hypothetical protein